MGYQEQLRRRHAEQETIFTDIISTITRYGKPLLSERARQKLQGAQTTINHLSTTHSGLNLIKEVDFIINDGTTFMWDRRLPAAVAYGRIAGQGDLLLTGGIFYPGALRRNGIDPTENDFFPALLSEIPGYFSTFDHSFAFRGALSSPYTFDFVVGGTYPETRTQIPLPLSSVKNHDHTLNIIQHLYRGVKMHIPCF